MNDLTRRYPILVFFNNDGVHDRLHGICQQFNALAYKIAKDQKNPETEMSLRKLLEARDCYIRTGML